MMFRSLYVFAVCNVVALVEEEMARFCKHQYWEMRAAEMSGQSWDMTSMWEEADYHRENLESGYMFYDIPADILDEVRKTLHPEKYDVAA